MNELARRKRHVAEALMRTAICEAAVAVLREVGFGALTMDRVAEAAEVSKGTLYNYYADKDALVVATVESTFQPMRAQLQLLFADQGRSPEVLIEGIRLILEHVDQRDSLGRVLVSGGLSAVVDDELRRFREQIHALLAEVFQEAAGSGTLRPEGTDPAVLSRWLILTIDGVIRERLRYPEDCPPLEEELASLHECFIQFWFSE
jgi:AcrR family transcriptional regulator